MLALIQRVTEAKVTISNRIHSEIGTGYVVFLGIFEQDSNEDTTHIISKLLNLRIISDEHNKMNKSILDIKGEILVVSQFTLCADVTSGRRPSFITAMKPTEAKQIYDEFIEELQKSGLSIKTGEFGAMMNVQIHNDGPVTILLDSKTL